MQVIGFSGDDLAQAELLWTPLKFIFAVDVNCTWIALSPDESLIALESFHAHQGKISSLHQQKPLKDVARILSSTGAKDNQFLSISLLKHAIGQRRFVSLFRKGDVADNIVDLSVSDFTLSRAKDLINISLRSLDDTLTHNGYSLKTDKETQNLVSLNFGSETNQISSNTIVKQTDFTLGFRTTVDVLHHSTSLLAVLRIIFIDEVVDKIAIMIQEVRNKMRPTSGPEFTTLIDAMLQAISKPPTIDSASKQAYLLFCDRQFDVSHNNQMVNEYKEERTKKASDAQAAAIAIGAANLADMHEQLTAANKRSAAAMASSNSGYGAAPKKPKPNGIGAAKTGTNKIAMEAKRRAHLVQLIADYTKTNPVDGYAPANHIGVKPLCFWTASGKPCIAHNNGKCTQNTHVKLPTMSAAYLDWAAKRPTMKDVPKVL